MRFPPSFLDEIKARLPVSEVVRRRVALKKAGRELVGLSPFGQERTPSFFVNDHKMAWFDLSAGKNGNIFDFVMQTEGLSFPETVERLARDAGLALPARSPEAEREQVRRAGLHEVLEWAAAFFERQLAGHGGAKARRYLDERGIAASSRAEFRLGYAPAERHALRDALAAKGAGVDVMCEAGLLIHGDEIPVPYDRFRDRVMFPIADRSGKVIAFGGRALEKDVPAKYLNSPETPLFHKGRVLFNHHRARKAAHDRARVIAVEGYIDVVAMHAAGFPETVASLGTALTEDQLALLWQMAPQPLLCFDGDKAGRKAAYRVVDVALPLVGPSRTLGFALLPDGRDPDDLIRTEGVAAMSGALAAAVPLVDLIWARETTARDLATPEQRAALEAGLDAIAAAIRDDALRRHYKAEFGARLGALFGMAAPASPARGGRAKPGPMAGRFGRARPGQQSGSERRGYLSAPLQPSASLMRVLARDAQPGTLPPREALIMQLLLAKPELIADHGEDLATLEFSIPDVAALRDTLLDLAHDADAGEGLSSEPLAAAATTAKPGLRRSLGEAGFASLIARIDAAPGAGAWYLQPEAARSDAAEVLRQALTLHHKACALHKELLSAEVALATNASEASIARMRDIQEQLSTLTGTEAAVDGFGQSSGRAGPTL